MVKAQNLRSFCFFSTILFFLTVQKSQGQPLLKPHEVHKLKVNVSKNPKNVASRHLLAKHNYRQKKWSLVVENLAPVVESLKSVDLENLADSYLHLKDVQNAEAVSQVLLSQESISQRSLLISAEVYAMKSRSLQKGEQSQRSITQIFDILKTAQSQYPQSELIYNAYLDYLAEFITHHGPESLKILSDMVQKGVPFTSRHYSLSCRYHWEAGYLKKAEESCQLATQKDPSNPDNFIYLGQVYMQSGREKKGTRMLASLGRKFSKSEKALRTTASTYYNNQKLLKAYKFFKKATSHPQASSESWMGLAEVSFKLKKHQEALGAFTEHCFLTQNLNQKFRRATGLLKPQSPWKQRYRQRMKNCRKK